ncbi:MULTISPECIES: hypothetical protein [Lacticaseibacillus]|uniref:Uncharacterized protein n=1 Tax=Lacticaseibacillus zeae TaxID=57037 RepID=A0A5R8M248_LACZE|nr:MULTISPECIES: hypothetical protein [Lacticaseibacillus]TLF43580.1 hypothetical protein FEI14_01545 [Lacticaseibacillus zeae]WBF77185.1 hypothetical protein [Lacticaseibacillus phage R10.1]
MKATISSPLNRFATRTNTPQKVIAYAAKLGRSTINNYFHGTPIRANEATDIANSMNDSELSYEMANLFLGIPKLFSGDGIYHDLRGLLFTDKREEDEEKASFIKYDIEGLANDPNFTRDDAKNLKAYAFEKMDSTVADLTELNAICEMLGISIMDLFSERLPHYQKLHYMRKDEQAWNKDLH